MDEPTLGDTAKLEIPPQPPEPAAAPAPQGGAPSPGGGAPAGGPGGMKAWMIIAAVAALLVVAGVATAIWMSQRSLADEVAEQEALIEELESKLADDSMTSTATGETETPAETPAEQPAEEPAEEPADEGEGHPEPGPADTVVQYAYILGGSDNPESVGGTSGYPVRVDYVAILSGAEAAAAASAAGTNTLPDGTYPQNNNIIIRELLLNDAAPVKLIEWLETGTAGSSMKLGLVTDHYEFARALIGMSNGPSGVWVPHGHLFKIIVEGDSIIHGIEQVYWPGH